MRWTVVPCAGTTTLDRAARRSRTPPTSPKNIRAPPAERPMRACMSQPAPERAREIDQQPVRPHGGPSAPAMRYGCMATHSRQVAAGCAMRVRRVDIPSGTCETAEGEPDADGADLRRQQLRHMSMAVAQIGLRARQPCEHAPSAQHSRSARRCNRCATAACNGGDCRSSLLTRSRYAGCGGGRGRNDETRAADRHHHDLA